jgi:hypothetical protein
MPSFFSHLTSQDLRTPFYPPGEQWPQDWPPGWLWDLLYRVICAKKYHLPVCIEFLNGEVGERFYPEGVKTAKDRAKREIEQKKKEQVAKTASQNAERDDRANRRAVNRQEMDAFDLVFGFWTFIRSTSWGKEQVRKQEEAVLEQERLMERANVQESIEKVSRWLNG